MEDHGVWWVDKRTNLFFWYNIGFFPNEKRCVEFIQKEKHKACVCKKRTYYYL